MKFEGKIFRILKQLLKKWMWSLDVWGRIQEKKKQNKQFTEKHAWSQCHLNWLKKIFLCWVTVLSETTETVRPINLFVLYTKYFWVWD